MLNKKVIDMLGDCAEESDAGTSPKQVVDWVINNYNLTDRQEKSLRGDYHAYIAYVNDNHEL